MTSIEIPAAYVDKARQLYGAKADGWLDGLAEQLSACADRFHITLGEPYPDLSWNLIFKVATSDGTPAVLKLSPLADEIMREAAVLRVWAGRGGVRVLDEDAELGAVLLERIAPGTPLAAITDDTAATRNFCTVFRALHGRAGAAAISVNAVSLREHMAAIERYWQAYVNGAVAGPLPADSVNRARTLLNELVASTDRPVLLHGDLHHGNILRRGIDGWAVIDPKGITGDIHFEPIQYLLNYVDRGGDADEVLRRRVGVISDGLGLDPKRITDWGIVRGVLEACWTLEDGAADWQAGIAISERFARLAEALC